MPTPYQFALLLVRLFAAMGIVAGVVLLVGSFVLGLTGFGAAKPLEGVPYSLICYGLLDLIGSIGTLLLAKKIATFAAQT
ncbi:MAG: hypothetical protein C0484_15545 [Rhodospirillum sp.]|nr:hypothetical protein [Rhodospirillum sp.]